MGKHKSQCTPLRFPTLSCAKDGAPLFAHFIPCQTQNRSPIPNSGEKCRLGTVTTVDEWPGGFSVVACDELTIAAQEILIGSQSIQAHRTAGMQLARAH